MRPTFTVHRNAADQDQALADMVSGRLAAAIAARGSASLVVSGGRTPLGLFDLLSMVALRWESVTVTLADERWVDRAHGDSNERLVRAHLLRNAAAAANFVSLKNAAATPEEGVAETAAALAKVRRPFDVVLLGMGEDGHTASLFPAAPELADGLSPTAMWPCLAVNPPHAPHARMSLTLGTLLDSRSIIVQLTGAAKRQVIERALEGGPVEDMPIRGILHQAKVPVGIFWSP
jgi:6-phosphogluconolactonase